MTDFHKTSSIALNQLADFFESSWPNADVDLLEDVLIVLLPGDKQYVINKHGVTQQVWLSSPFTGAHHFAYQEDAWRCTRTEKLLSDLLRDEQKIYAA
jgi:iron donor protein CyaY